MTSRPVWTGGALAWDDGPEAVRVRMDLGTACEATAVTIVPFLRTERREVLEVRVLGVTRRLRALDGEPLTVALPPRSTVRELEIGVRSLIGEPFALWDLRVHGDPQTCAGGWRPLARPDVLATSVGRDELLRLAGEYPNDARAMLGIARRLTAPETRADAEALLRGALSRDPLAAPAWVELGLMLDADGRFAGALGAYRRALAADSNNAWAYGCLAWAELRASHPVRALYHAWRASRLDPRYSDAFTIMAAAVRRFGLERVAGAMLRRAIRLDPQRNWPYLELAQMHADAGDTGAAVGVLDSLLKIVPDDAQARQMMAALQTGAATEPSS
jgi:Tfp pilus assembly protein PilF